MALRKGESIFGAFEVVEGKGILNLLLVVCLSNLLPEGFENGSY